MKSKKIFILFTVAVLTVGISTGAYGASLAKKISAYQNAGIKVMVDGNTLDLSDSTGALDPIVYNGHSYVPAKAVAEAMGGTVSWDADTTSVIITTGAAGQERGSIKDPIKLGTSFTYTDIRNYEGSDKESAQYTITIKKVEPISDEAIVNLILKKPEKNALLENVIVTVDLQVKNATFTKRAKSPVYDYQFLSLYKPSVWGVKTADGNSLKGGTDGFEGSLDTNIHMAIPDYPKVYEGDTKSYTASGKIIMSVYKDLDNLFVLEKQDSKLENDDKFIYFKLK